MQVKAFELLKEKSYQALYDLSVGKVFSNRIEMAEYIGDYSRFDTDLKTCKLWLDEKEFDVDFIGTSSLDDNMWFSAEIERQISDAGVDEIINVRKLLTRVGLEKFCPAKIELSDKLTPDMLATIYTAFMPEKQAYYIGSSGDLSLFMRINSLPDELFSYISPAHFIPRVMEIISTTNVKNHKLMVESFLLNNGCTVKVKGNTVVGVFKETEITFVFDDKNHLLSTSGVLNDGGKKPVEDTEPVAQETQDVLEDTVLETQETPQENATPDTVEDVNAIEAELEDVKDEEVVDRPVVLSAEETEVDAPVVLPEEPTETPVVLPPQDEVRAMPEIADVDEEQDLPKENEEAVVPLVVPTDPNLEIADVDDTPDTIPAEEDTEGEDDEEFNRIVDLADAMLNCSEQTGLFDELGVEDEETIQKICTATAIRIINNGETPDVIIDSIIAACDRNGYTLSDKTARLFASCYIDSYLTEE